jgi:cephalosporin hydroxylase
VNPLREYFEANTGRLIDKWLHYFDVYHRHFERFRGRPVTVLEFGVFHGGSLQMWKHYFGPQARIIGVDIDERCRALAEEQIEVRIGDQGDRAFLRSLAEDLGPVDLVVDDGAHMLRHQAATFEEIFPAVAADGVYLVEDLHTGYWAEYGGGYPGRTIFGNRRAPRSFIEYSKDLVDRLNA